MSNKTLEELFKKKETRNGNDEENEELISHIKGIKTGVYRGSREYLSIKVKEQDAQN